jgi:signal peptidase I
MTDEPEPRTAIDDLLAEDAAEMAAREPSAEGPTTAPSGKKRKRGNPLLEWIVVIVVAVGAALLVRTYVLQQFAVDGHSMDTTLHNGDRVLVNKLSYRLHDPNRGDVVVLETIEDAGARDLIKRVVGLPGETIEYRDCVLYVDGREVVEPYLDPAIVQPENCGQGQESLVVPENSVYVLGDNRGGSKDSRELGPIAYEELVGRAFVIIFPFSDWSWL